jgi:peptide/nickel transport system substrate-binding protein
MLRVLKRIFYTTLMATLVFAAAPISAREDTVVIGAPTTTAFRNNPLWATSSADFYVFPLILPGLTWFDDQMNPVLALAEDVAISDDGLTYTFTLPENATWSDGEPITAADVKFTWELKSHPALLALPQPPAGRGDITLVAGVEAYSSGQADEISGIQVIDDRTVSFTLNAPNFLFLGNATLGILPKHILGDVDPAEIVNHPYMEMPNVTSGPYMLTEYERDNFWRLEARADYWGKPANITHVIVRAFADNQAQMAAMEAGEIDVTAVPVAEVERFENLDGVNVVSRSGLGYYVLHFNLSAPRVVENCSAETAAEAYTGRAPLDDVRVRQAISFAIDREEIIDVIANGQGTRIFSSIFGPDWLDNSGLEAYDYDRERALELLAEAGWTLNEKGDRLVNDNGEPFRQLVYVAQAGQESFDLGILVQDYLGAVGIPVEIRLTTSSNFLPTVFGEEWDLARNVGGTLGRDPSESARFYRTCAGWANAIGYSNPAWDELMSRGAATTDLTERAAIYNEASRILNTELPSLFLMAPNVAWAVSDRIQGFTGSAGGYITWNLTSWMIG